MENERTLIEENIARLKASLAPYREARLMAVIKTRTNEEIAHAIACGIDLVGENRVQELLAHYETVSGRAELHFIGTLQKNKVKYIIDKADMIESVDSLPLAMEIERQGAKHGIVMPILFEVNIGREESKSGVLPDDLPALCEGVAALSHLRPMGLMTVAPRCESPEQSRSYFAELRRLCDEVFAPSFPKVEAPMLSMGMSESYPAALSCGATVVRIGKGIFGERRVTVQN